jgi:hypothetical protein
VTRLSKPAQVEAFREDVTGTRLRQPVVDHDMSWADVSGAPITPDSRRCRQVSRQASKAEATSLKRGLVPAEYDLAESRSCAVAAY